MSLSNVRIVSLFAAAGLPDKSFGPHLLSKTYAGGDKTIMRCEGEEQAACFRLAPISWE